MTAAKRVVVLMGGASAEREVSLASGTECAKGLAAAGCRGLSRGGAMVSEKHCNFLINTGTATAADLEALGEEVRARVADKFGVTLEWEIRRIGEPAPKGRPA